MNSPYNCNSVDNVRWTWRVQKTLVIGQTGRARSLASVLSDR